VAGRSLAALVASFGLFRGADAVRGEGRVLRAIRVPALRGGYQRRLHGAAIAKTGQPSGFAMALRGVSDPRETEKRGCGDEVRTANGCATVLVERSAAVVYAQETGGLLSTRVLGLTQ